LRVDSGVTAACAAVESEGDLLALASEFERHRERESLPGEGAIEGK
jgi:hypothetical protein